MILSFEVFIFAVLFIGFGVFIGLWLYYDHRDRQLYDEQRVKHVFHCTRCDHLHTAAVSSAVKCPRCGQENTHLRF